MEATAKGRIPYKWIALQTVLLGVVLSVLDSGVTSISLPAISSHFDVELATVQWVVSVYLLTIGALMLPFGRAADLLGRKKLYVFGFGLFVVGAALSASAQSVTWLLIARGVQAAGAASIQANAMAIAVAVFPPEERGKALGIVGSSVAIGATIGPIVGGTLVDAFDWRAAFVLSLSVGVIGGIVAAIFLDEKRISSPTRQRGADWVGMASSSVALVAALLLLSRGHSFGWTSPISIGIGVAALLSAALFVVTELRVPFPMLDLKLLRKQRFSLGSAALMLSFAAIMSNSFMLPFYLQGVLGHDARTAGLMLVPMASMLAVWGILGGRLSDRIGPRGPATFGMALAFVGMLGVSRLGQDSGTMAVILPIMAIGAGMGMFMPANNSSVLSVVDPERLSTVSAFINLMRNTGQVVGIAIASLIVTLAVANLGIHADLGVLKEEGRSANPALAGGFVDGMRQAYLVAAALVGAAGLMSLAAGSRQKATANRAGRQSQKADV